MCTVIHTIMPTNTLFQGLDAESLASQFGTPLYIYDAEVILRQVGRLREAFRQVPLRIKYAAKALTNLSILRLLRHHGVEMDAVSIEEAQIGLTAGYQPAQIMFTPNSVGFDEISRAVQMGIGINIDALPVLELFGQTYGDQVPCCLRINPHIVAGGNAKIQVGHAGSKFGISVSQQDELLRIVRQYNIQVHGLHIHTGSEIGDSQVFMQTADVLFEMAFQFEHLRFLDFGGGFKVAYRPEDKATDLNTLGQVLSKAFMDFCQRYGRDLELWFEPGKLLVAEAGILLVRANIVKPGPLHTFVGVDSGLNHLIRPMMYGAFHDILNLSHPAGPPKSYDVVGYICETDTLGHDLMLPEVRPGDLLAICHAGAYGFSMSSNYNSRPRPAEVLVMDGQPHLIRRRETLEDLLATQQDVFATGFPVLKNA